MSEATPFQTLSYLRQDNGVVRVTIDVKDRPVNVLTPELHREIGEVASLLATDEEAVGAVIHSGKSSFMAGGDLKRIVSYYDQNRSAEQAYSQSRTYTESLRKLETCGKPVAVAINGTALGGGLELALACHHRVVSDDAAIMLGFPEVSLGLLPGGGGTQRLPRLIGLKQAASLILESKRIGPDEALQLGIVNQLAAEGDLIELAEQWVLQTGDPLQPWDKKGFKVPGGSGLNNMNVGRLFQQLTAKVSAKHRHNYPAPIAVLSCLFNGTTVLSMDAALKIETREFSALTRDPVARNIIRTLFINKGKSSRKDILAEEGVDQLQQRCEQAFINQGMTLANEGLKPALIRNAAFAAGLNPDQLILSAKNKDQIETATNTLPVITVKQRLLCSQALAATQCWEEGVTEPIIADLASILGWGFPSYTGGVMSYIDTLGLKAFIALCDELSFETGATLKPSDWLRNLAQKDNRIYPSMVRPAD
jgi:3-hydroxyacyl-CoA dehydrogenase/enoyl-CoA hydratase/3-hydroxybutyryl-CoA epimerase